MNAISRWLKRKPVRPTLDNGWDTPGLLSIVVQGPLLGSNIDEIASHCKHWRALFPHCELILSASVSEFGITGGKVRTGADGLSHRINKDANAIKAINSACDKVVYAQVGAVPLPPISHDSATSNNVNLQLAAARAGLATASGLYSLRVRSDFLFLDRSFISQYEALSSLSRGTAARFKQRILTSWLYTLNPFAVEKFPFHYSDWFHFGLTEDLLSLWDVPEMSFHDAIFFRNDAYPKDENQYEKYFYPRVAIEQHLAFNWAKREFQDIELSYRSDNTSVAQSIDILVDNFVLCDFHVSSIYFPKYGSGFADPARKTQCISPPLWRSLVNLAPSDRLEALQIAAQKTPSTGRLSFPRYFSGAMLTPKDSYRSGWLITNSLPSGLLCFGPYTDLIQGNFRITADLYALSDDGTLKLRVTADHGDQILGEKVIQVRELRGNPSIEFSVTDLQVCDVELLCEIYDVDVASIAGITVELLDSVSTDANYKPPMPQEGM